MLLIYTSPSTIPGLRALPHAEQVRLWKECYRETASLARTVIFGSLGLGGGLLAGYLLGDRWALGIVGTALGLILSGVRHLFVARTLASRRASAWIVDSGKGEQATH
jgi:hypothetical protein